MSATRRQRAARQNLETDRLLGIDSVPAGDPSTSGPSAVASPGAAGPVEVSAPPPSQSLYAAAGDTGMDRSAKAVSLEQLDADEVRGCTKCTLSENRTQTVFGEGDPDADLMFIGEGPGQREDEQGRPFVGRAGELLDKQIAAMGLERKQVYIANIVKCRPPNNRAPTPVEVDACWGYLRRQIHTIQPRVIVTLGGPATKLILETTTGITALRGTWHRFDGLLPEGPSIPVMPTFHPAYLLRAYTQDNRRKVWSDLQKVMQQIATPKP